MLNISKCFPSILRNFSTVQASNFLEPLTNRKIIRVSGSEVSDFLQGLITNDIHHLDHGIGSMYAMFLNTKGRVLYDTLIYKSEEKDTYLIECDIDALGPLQRHLKMYRVRRKIDITSLEKEINVFALFNPENVDYKDGKAKRLDGIIVPCDALNETQPDNGCTNIGEISIFSDPRVVALGARILAPDNCDVLKEISKAVLVNTQETPSKNYKQFRYNLGVGEGVIDLPPDNCFPLEANCDYLHGVSFHKGCYIGQELTARTHHTGVVRKRLMPLFFNNDLVKIPEDKTILNETVNLGKLRGVEGKTGLALLRIVKAIGCENIKIGNCLAKTEKPNWWPIEAPKEKMSA